MKDVLKEVLIKYGLTLVVGFVFWHFIYLTYSTLYGFTLIFFLPDNPTVDLAVKVIAAPICAIVAYRLVSEELKKRKRLREKNLQLEKKREAARNRMKKKEETAKE